ncbi:hypothetical protein BS78_10G253800 [Paspalum vaginatum]|nr:hypothetical protein BS78_10G253800 [Paspalum vaginatum]
MGPTCQPHFLVALLALCQPAVELHTALRRRDAAKLASATRARSGKPRRSWTSLPLRWRPRARRVAGGGGDVRHTRGDRGLHIFCLRPILPRMPVGDWFCAWCRCSPSSKAAATTGSLVAKKPKQFPLVQTKIVDFFEI